MQEKEKIEENNFFLFLILSGTKHNLNNSDIL